MRPAFCALLLLVAARGEELSVSGVVATIRFHPQGHPSRDGLRWLSGADAAGWRALASLLSEFEEPHPEIARLAAEALAEGPEKERLEICAAAYGRARDPALRAILVHALAFGYSDHEKLVWLHLKENRPGAAEALRVLAPKVLGEQALRELLAVPDLARIAYDALRERRHSVRVEELRPWGRAIARQCLDPAACEDWLRREPDLLVWEAVALALDDPDEDVRDGAQCLLCTLSGKNLQRDPLIWRSWLAAQRERHARPEPVSEGAIAAAVVRGARFLRLDLLDDGRCLASADPGGSHVLGSTALAVLALRAAGYPPDHPAIDRALKETLLVIPPGGAPALREQADPSRETYCLSLLAMALCELDAKRYATVLGALRSRIVNGMRPHGEWGYRCLGPTDAGDPGIPDKSNTQYAVLALRALARAGHAVPEATWRAVAEHHAQSNRGNGEWWYRTHEHHGGREISMTAAGISSLAIALEGLHGRHAAARIQGDPVLERARVFLGQRLLGCNFDGEELYSMYGVERACVLTATEAFRSERRTFDWHAIGARKLLERQDPDGHWGWPLGHWTVGQTFGPAVDTAYGVLFLTRATRTIGGSRTVTIRVSVPEDRDRALPPPRRVEPDPPPAPEPPRLVLARDRLGTRDGALTVRGRVDPPDSAVAVDGRAVAADARGRFSADLTLDRNRAIPVEATGANGLSARAEVRAAFDLDPPRITLSGPMQRHLGTQVLHFYGDEPLRCLTVGGRQFPATSGVVRAAVDVGEGRRTLTVVATDVAGNEERAQFEVEARNRVLVVDGRSAVGVDLRESPGTFTLECWARGSEAASSVAVVANTEGSGFGLFWWIRGRPLPCALVRAGRDWIGVDAKKAWRWGTWTHLALSFDGATLRYFVDGRMQGQAEGAPFVPSGRRLFIGAQPLRNDQPGEFFTGAIDEVRLSRVCRYTADFRPERVHMRDEHTVLLFHFDRETFLEGVALDDSDMHHHGALFGAPVLQEERR